MTTLADYIASQSRRPSARVYLDGRRWYGVRTIAKTQSYGRGPAAFTIEGVDPPVTPAGGMAIRWTWGYNDVEIPGGTGYVTDPEQISYPHGWSLSCQDVLWRAGRESRAIATVPLNTITAQAAIQYILETYAGITRHDIPDIPAPSDSGTSWTLGTLTPVSWDNATPLSAIQEIAGTAGYWVYADAGGTVRATQMERRPSDSPFRTLRRGDASSGGALLVDGAPRRRQPIDQIKNRITVRGANTGVEGAQLYDTYLATHAVEAGLENSLEYGSFLLEVIADVTAVAERLAGLWNREPNIITARIKADPRINVGMTLAIQDANIGYSSARNFFVYQIDTTLDLRSGRFDQSITLDGGVGDSGYTLIPPPVAVASYTIELETTDGTAIAVVTVDGSASYSQSAGEIVSYAWSTTGVVSSTPTTASTATATFLYPVSASPVTITLTVTDTSSKTGTTDLVIDLANPDVPADLESLNVAFGAAWAATGDGGATWNSYVTTTTRVPPIGGGGWESAPAGDAATYGILASGGTALMQSVDALASAPTTAYTAAGSITALAVNAKNAARVWIAVGDTVYRSIDGGASFTSWGVPGSGDDVVDILEDPALENSVFALAGADMYQSLGDGAPGWSVLYAGPTGATARWMQRSQDGAITWVCYTGTFTGAPLQRVEGPITVTPGSETEIRAIALLDAINPTAPLLVVFGGSGAIYHVDGLTGAVLATSTAAYPAGAIVQHAMPGQKASIVYTADYDSVASGTGAVRKYFPDSQSLLLYKAGATGQQAHMVGLTGIGRALPDVMVLRLPTGATGDADKLFIYAADSWTAKALPESGRSDWQRIVASPFNPDKLLLYRCNVTDGATNSANNKLWYSDDFGDSWTAVFENLTLRTDQETPPVEWSPSNPNEWMTTAHYSDTAQARQRVIRGTNASYSIVYDEIGFTFDRLLPTYGIGGELPFMTANGDVGYIAADNTAVDTGNAVGFVGYADLVPFTRKWASCDITPGGTVDVTTDYLTTDPTTISGTEGKSVAFLADGTLFIGGRSNGVQQVLDPFGTPAVSVATETGVTIRWVRSDRQTQTLVAATIGSVGNLDTTVRDASGVWARLPAIPNATGLTEWVEVIGVET